MTLIFICDRALLKNKAHTMHPICLSVKHSILDCKQIFSFMFLVDVVRFGKHKCVITLRANIKFLPFLLVFVNFNLLLRCFLGNFLAVSFQQLHLRQKNETNPIVFLGISLFFVKIACKKRKNIPFFASLNSEL